MEHPFRWDDRGGVSVVDLAGHRVVLADGYAGEEGLAWAPGGKELFFSVWGQGGSTYQIAAVDLQGHMRHPLPTPGNLTVQDVTSGGAWLATSDDMPGRMMVRAPGSPEERDLSWLDGSVGPVISGDGSTIVFTDQSAGAAPNYSVCLRKTDGSSVLHLGEGGGNSLRSVTRWRMGSRLRSCVAGPLDVVSHRSGRTAPHRRRKP